MDLHAELKESKEKYSEQTQELQEIEGENERLKEQLKVEEGKRLKQEEGCKFPLQEQADPNEDYYIYPNPTLN